MAGKICKIISGGRLGQIAFVSNKQEKQITDCKKVHAYFFNKYNSVDYYEPIVMDGKHMNGLISIDRLITIGFYD